MHGTGSSAHQPPSFCQTKPRFYLFYLVWEMIPASQFLYKLRNSGGSEEGEKEKEEGIGGRGKGGREEGRERKERE